MIATNQPSLDLGEVSLDSDTLFEVTVRNTFPDPKLVTAQPSCGSCTHLVEMPDVIPSGREGIFKFKYHPTATGDSVKSIFFQIDGKTEQTFMFRAKAV